MERSALRERGGAALDSRGRETLATFFSENIAWLSPTAFRLAGRALDSGDLLGDAVLAAAVKTAEGRVASGALGAYVVQSMRHRVTDELRSPRSRVHALEEDGVERPADEDPALRQADLLIERQIVRAAFGRLGVEEQRALWAHAVDGLRPRDLSAALSRMPEDVHGLVYRAKAKLRRALLQVLLEQSGAAARRDCAQLHDRLPARIPRDPDQARTLPLVAAHLEHCSPCRAMWSHYTHLATAAIWPGE